jgi:hypothetical protein
MKKRKCHQINDNHFEIKKILTVKIALLSWKRDVKQGVT